MHRPQATSIITALSLAIVWPERKLPELNQVAGGKKKSTFSTNEGKKEEEKLQEATVGSSSEFMVSGNHRNRICWTLDALADQFIYGPCSIVITHHSLLGHLSGLYLLIAPPALTSRISLISNKCIKHGSRCAF